MGFRLNFSQQNQSNDCRKMMEMTFKKLDAQAVEITVCIAPLGLSLGEGIIRAIFCVGGVLKTMAFQCET